MASRVEIHGTDVILTELAQLKCSVFRFAGKSLAMSMEQALSPVIPFGGKAVALIKIVCFTLSILCIELAKLQHSESLWFSMQGY